MRTVSGVLAAAALFVAAAACSSDARDDDAVVTAPGPDPGAADGPPRGGAAGAGGERAAPPASKPAPPAAGPPAVLQMGRVDDRDPAGPTCGWPGCRFLARFSGTAVSARLVETPYLEGPSEWDVTIDGARKPKLVLEPGSHVYDLASELAPGTHLVELYKRTEAQNGVTQFLGFDFHGGTLLAPPPRPSRRIEVVGDSDVSGYGYEGTTYAGKCPGPPWAARFENYRGTWASRLEDKLQAEVNGTAYTGKGWVQNSWRPDKETIDVVFPRANPIDVTSTWDFSRFVADVVVVAVGGNDYNLGQPEDTGPSPLPDVIAKVRALTATLRAHYPQAHVFLMAYALLSDEYPPGRLRRTNIETALRTVRDERAAAGDPRVYFVAPTQFVSEEITGCDGHGGPEYHERIATFLAGEIRKATGWK